MPSAASMILHRRSASASIQSAGIHHPLTPHRIRLNSWFISTFPLLSLIVLNALFATRMPSTRPSISVMEMKWEKGELPYQRKPTNEQVIETMKSKTF